MKTYSDKGWSAGPHLFLAAAALNAANTGIFQLTPIQHMGVHAGPCNSSRIGIENVGDFDARAPTPAQWQLMINVNVALCRAWHLPASQVLVHKECMLGRTCPGRHFDVSRLRADVHTALLNASTTHRYRVKAAATAGVTVRAAPRRNAAIVARLHVGDTWVGEPIVGQLYTLAPFGSTDIWIRSPGGACAWSGLFDETP